MTEKTKDNGDPRELDASYILIRKGTSLTKLSKIPDESSLESKIARSRGGGKVIEKPKPKDGDERTLEHAGKMIFEEGKLKSETNYL